MEYIKIDNKRDILKIGLQDMEGNNILDKDGNQAYWEFDVADIEIPLKIARAEEQYYKDTKETKAKLIAVDKKQDSISKAGLSKNEVEKVKLVKEYMKKQVTILETIIGKDGVDKFLNGRDYYIEMFDDIMSALEQILPMIEKKRGSIEDRIKKKYGVTEENILE